MKKILFNDKLELTQAVLDGRKTMTRRIIKRSQLFKRCPDGMWSADEIDAWKNSGISDSDFFSDKDKKDAFEWLKLHAPYKVGEVVAVAQSYKDLGYDGEEPLQGEIGYYPHIKNAVGWKNKMFVRADKMPHHIRITKVHIERIQEISAEDCIKEGIRKLGNTKNAQIFGFEDKFEIPNGFMVYDTPQEAFAELICKICGCGTWERNPFVLVYEFELVD